MKCASCGKKISEHQTDVGFQLPDVVWQLSEPERTERAKFNNDLCQLDDERYFIRCIALIPMKARSDSFAWGFWAEVSKGDFFHYMDIYEKDATTEPAIVGTIANSPRSYPRLEGYKVDIQYGLPTQRPFLKLHPSDHPLYYEQQEGISDDRLHEILINK